MSDITEKFENEILKRLTKALSSAARELDGGEEYKGTLTKGIRIKEDLKKEQFFLARVVEEEFDVNVSYEKIQKFQTIGDYVDFIYKEEIFGRR